MATFDKSFVDQHYRSLDHFAAEDECQAIYAYASYAGGPKDHYFTIRHPRDVAAMRASQFIIDPEKIWPVS